MFFLRGKVSYTGNNLTGIKRRHSPWCCCWRCCSFRRRRRPLRFWKLRLSGSLASSSLTLSLLSHLSHSQVSLLLETHSHSQLLHRASLQFWHWLKTHLRNICLPSPSQCCVCWIPILKAFLPFFSWFFGCHIHWFCSFLSTNNTFFLIDLDVWIRM